MSGRHFFASPPVTASSVDVMSWRNQTITLKIRGKISSESVESEPGLANAKRREAPVLEEPKETSTIFEKHRKKSSSISPKHQPSTLALVGNGGGLFLFRVCRDFVRGDVERRGQRAVRADGTRPIKSQRFLFHQRQR